MGNTRATITREMREGGRVKRIKQAWNAISDTGKNIVLGAIVAVGLAILAAILRAVC